MKCTCGFEVLEENLESHKKSQLHAKWLKVGWNGRCVYGGCKERPVSGRVYCQVHAKRNVENMRKNRERNHAEGRCWCGGELSGLLRICSRCRESKKRWKLENRDAVRAQRKAARKAITGRTCEVCLLTDACVPWSGAATRCAGCERALRRNGRCKIHGTVLKGASRGKKPCCIHCEAMAP